MANRGQQEANQPELLVSNDADHCIRISIAAPDCHLIEV